MQRKLPISILLIAFVAPLFFPSFGLASEHHFRASNSHRNSIPPRLQWNANGGYCGEVSLISAGLFYGQYISQYEARAIAIRNGPQNRGELLLGVNDRYAASKMHLNSVRWNPSNERGTNPSNERGTSPFLRWVKRNVLKGRPVIIGVFTNEYRFYGDLDPNAGDPQYDHIVPVVRVRSKHSFKSRKYFGADRITFSDNGLWGDTHHRPYHFTFAFDAFPADRKQANAPNGPVYSLPNKTRNYGIVISGVMDVNGDTLPVRVETNKNYELPAIRNGTNARPASMPLTLRITISELTPNTRYKLYRYNNLASVPDSNFNAHASAASEAWNIQIPSGQTYVLTQQIRSDEIAVYRAVMATAP